MQDYGTEHWITRVEAVDIQELLPYFSPTPERNVQRLRALLHDFSLHTIYDHADLEGNEDHEGPADVVFEEIPVMEDAPVGDAPVAANNDHGDGFEDLPPPSPCTDFPTMKLFMVAAGSKRDHAWTMAGRAMTGRTTALIATNRLKISRLWQTTGSKISGFRWTQAQLI